MYDDLIKKSKRAHCPANEFEVVVKTGNVGAASRKLINAGYKIVGKSYGGGSTTKVWFLK